MPTRRSVNDERPQERFLSDPAFVRRRGILANAVAEKAQLYRSRADRSLLFFLQSLSMQDGGIATVAADILRAFPKRVNKQATIPGSPLEDYAAYLAGATASTKSRTAKAFAGFLERLCIDPALNVSAIREAKSSPDAEYLRDPVGAIEEFRSRRISERGKATATTSIGRRIESLLNYAAETSRMVIMIGDSGSGKTFATESWCDRHRGEAVFVTLSGITHRTGFFKNISAAVGLANCQEASSKLQARVESYFAATRRILVIDEAHFLWPQHQRSHSAPELIDWVNTALINNRVPVALVATPQFAQLKSRCEKQVGWNSDQLVHRTARFEVLPPRPSKEDVLAVTRNLLSCRWCDENASWVFDGNARPDPLSLKTVASYGVQSPLPLAAVRSFVENAQCRARASGRKRIDEIDIEEATDSQEISDTSIRSAFRTAQRSQKRPLGGAADDASAEQMSNFSRSSDNVLTGKSSSERFSQKAFV